jgi:hypothetical protein
MFKKVMLFLLLSMPWQWIPIDPAWQPSDYMFVYSAQPLARPKKCLALRVFCGASRKAEPDTQRILDDICKAYPDRNIKVRDVCSGSDSGYNKPH